MFPFNQNVQFNYMIKKGMHIVMHVLIIENFSSKCMTYKGNQHVTQGLSHNSEIATLSSAK